MADLTPFDFALALAIATFAGYVKGVAGFAMPLIMMSAFTSFMSPQLALAGLILPTLLTNLSQALRQGRGPAMETARTYRRFLIGCGAFILISSPFVTVIPEVVFVLALGIPVTAFALMQLAGKALTIRPERRGAAEWALGVIAGIYGGISGIWGPPLTLYLLAIKAEKRETVRVQGVVFLMGAVLMVVAHLHSGVLNARTAPFSAALALAAQIGQFGGNAVQDRMDAVAFRRWTQILLAATGLNLVRQGLWLIW